ncbi:restriction endonuclease subunit S [Salinimicrobium sp. TIG7-5_MAKvit]|uniref:restriction endonuclease subunit S n=1 Tax=Salinimicrobium sp. TIG7-5_MAKvit TaxID=3121289 RepID=UPI003C6DD42B
MTEDYIDCKVGDLLKLKNGYAFKSNIYQNDGIPVIRIGDIQDWNVNIESAKKIAENKDFDSYQVKNGDILIAMSGATTGKFGLYSSEEKAYQNQRVGNLVPHNDILTQRKYIYYLLYSLKREIEKEAYGGAQPNISASKIENLETLLFPLPIQRAIVAKIEELFSSLDSGIADLKKAQEQLKIYRHSLIDLIFKNILVEKSEKKKLKVITDKIGSGATPKGGRSAYKTQGIPFVRSLNIHFDFIKYEGLAFIDEVQAEKLSNVTIKEGDVLLNITGASIGRVNIAPKEFDDGRVNQHVSIIRSKLGELYHPYLKYFLQSPNIQSWIANENYGATRQALTKGMLENLEVPCPSFELQKKLVEELEEKISSCKWIEKTITQNLIKAERLRQSILKKAFEGKLLSEEEIEKAKKEHDYEPADVLLQKIKAEKKKK